MRLDLYLVQKGLAPSRSRAAEMIKNGAVAVNGTPADKPSMDVDGKTVEVTGGELPYVSRGGLKLERALDLFALDVTGLVCLDLGASTGGFTDCLLQHGAARVYALDVGRGQLHEKLRNDPRVVSMEKRNAREIRKGDFPEQISLIVSDLSFISQKLVYEAVSDILPEGGLFVSLIKPQFEAGRSALNKKGIVKDKKDHERVIAALAEEAAKCRLAMGNICRSPITGGDGNIEYIALFILGGETLVNARGIEEAVYDKKKGTTSK